MTNRNSNLKQPWAVLCILAIAASPAAGAHEGIVEIWQPFIVAASLTLEIYPVPYYSFSDANGSLTKITAENRVWRAHLGQLENTNAANLAGLEVRRVHNRSSPNGLWGDTLSVVLDTGHIDVGVFADPPPPDTLVSATIECIRATAEPTGGSPGNATRYLKITLVPGGHTYVFDLRETYTPRTVFSIFNKR